MKFLLDPVWMTIIVSIMGIVIPLATSIILYIKQRTFKEVTYEVISNISLLDDRTNCGGKIKLKINRRSLSNANIITLKIWNSGNTPICPSDYIDPIRFSFGSGAILLDAEVLETKPNSINVILQHTPSYLEIEPLLLNSKELIKLKILLTEFRNEIIADGRIVGVKRIAGPSKIKQNKNIQAALMIVIASSIMLGIAATLSALLIGMYALIAITFAAIPLVFVIFTLFRMLISANKK